MTSRVLLEGSVSASTSICTRRSEGWLLIHFHNASWASLLKLVPLSARCVSWVAAASAWMLHASKFKLAARQRRLASQGPGGKDDGSPPYV